MELGATVCKPQNPDCLNCPLISICCGRELVQRRSEIERDLRGSNLPEIEDLLEKLPCDISYFPKKAAKKKPKDILLSVLVLCVRQESCSCGDEEPQFLFLKRPEKGLLASQWEFPTITLQVYCATSPQLYIWPHQRYFPNFYFSIGG